MKDLSEVFKEADLITYHLQDWDDTWPFALEPRLQRFYDHCLGLRQANETFSSRELFDPLDIPELLPHLQVLEAQPQEDGTHRYFIRLQGTAFISHHGFDATGKYLDQVLPEKNMMIANQHYAEQLSTGKVAFLRGKQVFSGREFYNYDRLMVPFQRSDTQQLQLIGCWNWRSGTPT